MTSMLDRLEKMGYVWRQRSKKDRRKILIKRTNKDRNLEKEYVPTFPTKYHIPEILKKYKDRVKIKVVRDTGGGAGTGAGHITIESLDPDLFVRDILKEFEIPTFRDEIKESEEVQARYRL